MKDKFIVELWFMFAALELNEMHTKLKCVRFYDMLQTWVVFLRKLSHTKAITISPFTFSAWIALLFLKKTTQVVIHLLYCISKI